ncbi:MAG: HD domain-containing protein [Solirubrobacteraceae bacterium]
MDVINTPEFQRLRGIGQLTPVDLVFPGATHNRFAHSIGAAHVIGMILSQKRVGKYFEGDRRRLIQPLRLAALLHDVGHLPFSHVGEMAWLLAAQPDAFAYHEAGKGPMTVFDSAARARAKPPLHEELSQLLITESRLGELIDRELDPVDGEPASALVRRIIAGTHPDLVARNLLSSDLDCDRLDYLLRDSLMAGLVYGHIDLSYLIGALLIATGNEGPTLAIDGRHGILTGEHFLLARYYHYAQFVTHKTVAAAEVTLVAAILELIRCERLPRTLELTGIEFAPAKRIECLMTLTDAHVEAKIAEAARGSGSQTLVCASRRLLERKLPKIAAANEGLERARRGGAPPAHNWDRLSKPEAKQQLADEIGVGSRDFFYRTTSLPLSGVPGDISPADAVKDPEGLRKSVRKAAKVSVDDAPPELLIDHSFVLKGLANHDWTTRRVFVLEPPGSYEPRCPSANFNALKKYFAEDKG